MPEGKRIIEGYLVVPLKNEAVKERYPFQEWRSDVDYNFTYSEPDAINPIDSQRAFRFQMVEPSLAQQKTMQVTLTSYHPVTHQPMDEVKITLHRDKNAKIPGTFVSDPLALTSYRDNALNGALSDQVMAYAGSQLAISYAAINEETVKIPIGSAKVERVLEIDVVIFKDGQEDANLQLAESQLAEQVAADLAPLGIQVKINTHLVDKPIELDGASPEKMASIAKQHASNPQAITMVMGARNHGTFYSSTDSSVSKSLRNTLFIDHVQISDQISKKMNYYGADEIVPQMLLISSGYLEAGREYSWADYHPTQDRAKYYHASPLLSEPPKPQVVVDPFTAKPALVP